VRHVTTERLDAIEPMLDELREIDGLVERTRGAFYRRSRGFLHFHEDGNDLYCDVKLDGEHYERVRATTVAERRRVLAQVRRAIAAEG
jgi:hypothetical protein